MCTLSLWLQRQADVASRRSLRIVQQYPAVELLAATVSLSRRLATPDLNLLKEQIRMT